MYIFDHTVNILETTTFAFVAEAYVFAVEGYLPNAIQVMFCSKMHAALERKLCFGAEHLFPGENQSLASKTYVSLEVEFEF